MRKIFTYQELDETEFKIRAGVFMRSDNSEKPVELLSEYDFDKTPLSRFPKEFTRSDIDKILAVEKALEDKGLPPLTEEEMQYIISPLKMNMPATANASIEEMQRLAGFEVKKSTEVRYVNQNHSNEEET